MKTNSIEFCKKLYRKTANLITLSVLCAFFGNLWFAKINNYMGQSFKNSGNALMLIIYFIILLGSFSLWQGFHIGYDTTMNIAISQVFALICANIVLMFQLILMVGNVFYTYIIMKEVVLLTVKGVVSCVFLAWIETGIYRKLFPAYRLLQINGYHKNKLKIKVSQRGDKYKICREISIDEPWKFVEEEILKYDAILINDVPSNDKNRILKYCFDKCVRVYFTPKISDILVKGSDDVNLFDTPLYLCKNIGLSKEDAVVKRIMDILISVFGLIVLLPVLLITAIAVKLEDGGPVFYKQKRCTIGGKVFWIYKFRSMIVDSEKDGIPRPAVDHDDRITKVGKFIRRTRIDEFPQLINVLKGDMSIVGPRPERVENMKSYSDEIPEFGFRLRVRGGLTGYAQVYGKYNTSPYDKLKMDLIYIQNYSVLLDVKIILMTFKIIFSRDSTEGFSEQDIQHAKGDSDDA